MTFVLIIIGLMILGNTTELLKLWGALTIELLKFVVTYGTLPLLLYISYSLRVKG